MLYFYETSCFNCFKINIFNVFFSFPFCYKSKLTLYTKQKATFNLNYCDLTFACLSRSLAVCYLQQF